MKRINPFEAFSLAELMIVMLILTIILAATMPILSKRAKVKAAAAAAAINLPIKQEGDPCTSGNVSISSDGTLLTCQGGQLKKPPSVGAETILYLYGDGNFGSCGYPYSSYYCANAPAPCPSNWSDAGTGVITGANKPYSTTTPTITVRSCYNPNQTCSALYLYGDGNFGSCAYPYSSYYCANAPAPCPSNWSDAGTGVITGANKPYSTTTPTIKVRSCYKCS